MKPLSRRRILLWLLGGLGLLLLAGGVAVSESRRQAWLRLERELDGVRKALSEGRTSTARRDLQALAERWPGRGNVLLLLGRTEQDQRKPERALEIWSQIPPTDPDFVPAAESRGHLLIDLGRLSQAEAVVTDALARAPEAQEAPLLRTMARLLRLEGRYREVSDALMAAWKSADNPSTILQELWQNDTEPVPVDGLQMMLEAADGQDDRVWLGRARAEMLRGRTVEAARWLDRCKERRLDDPAVGLACLDLAMASGDIEMFWEAAGRIPIAGLRTADVASMRVWLASRGEATPDGRKEWEERLAADPCNPEALEHLAELHRRAGEARQSEALLRRKGAIDMARDQIRRMIIRKIDFRSSSHELAAFCGVLGREFDRRAWTLVALSDASDSGPVGTSILTPAEADELRRFCAAASDEALGRLRAMTAKASTPGHDTLADRISDLREEATATSAADGSGPEPPRGHPSRIEFVDHASEAGLHFTFDSGHSPLWLLPESLAGGLGLIDFDGDGWLDVYCLQGGSAASPDAARKGAPAGKGDRLFRNLGNGSFADATAPAGLEAMPWRASYGMGIAVGDYDNDGRSDLFLTRLDRYVLLRNRGDGTFEDVTAPAGLGGPRDNPTSTTFADLDGDGDLDLYVCHYARWNPKNPPRCQDEQGKPYYCDPAKYIAAPDHVFRNDGGRFVDVTKAAGFTDRDGRGLGVAAADLDGDGLIDLFVANDGTANYHFRNRGNFRFEDVALTSGTASNAEGGFRAGMGVLVADLDADERLDVVVTNLYGEGYTLYQNLGQGLFADHSTASGVLLLTRYLTGFGVVGIDAANDGRTLLASANGHVNDFRPFYPYAMPARLLEIRMGTGGRTVDLSNGAGPAWNVPRIGRGVVAGDLDHDGRLDLLVVNQDEPLSFLRNQSARAGHFLTLRLEGTRSNRDAIGAVVTVVAEGKRQVKHRIGGGSYLAAGDPALHFGLGQASKVEAVEVRWPSGHVDRWTNLGADTGYHLREAESKPAPLAGYRP
jgi:tetratricopeptide (TPR) repeat protein